MAFIITKTLPIRFGQHLVLNLDNLIIFVNSEDTIFTLNQKPKCC